MRGKPFAAKPIAEVISPVGVLVNGKEAEVVNKNSWPGTTDRCYIDFRVRRASRRIRHTIQLTEAWIPGPKVDIPLQ